MTFYLNRVLFGGNLTRDPQVRLINDQKAVASFSLAMNRRYKGTDGETKNEVTFIDIEAWGRMAELVGQYLTKGRSCFVEGRLKLDEWTKDGVRHFRFKVIAESIQFMGSGKKSSEGNGEEENADGVLVGASSAHARINPKHIPSTTPSFDALKSLSILVVNFATEPSADC